jgi:hypothetical protein
MTRDVSDLAATKAQSHSGALWILLIVSSLYFIGYVVLVFMGYFDLATLPWGSRKQNMLDVLYWPLQWLRHL